MQKKIIAVAIAAAMSVPAIALADVTVYGQANVSYDFADHDSSDVNKVTSNGSRLGFKGSEDLGNGLSAIWQIESSVRLDASAGTAIGTRNSFAGLSSKDMGTVILGHHDTPYKLATRGFDVFADTVADNRSIMGGGSQSVIGAVASFDGRQPNVVAYLTPNLSGFTGAIAYTNTGDDTAAPAAPAARNDLTAWSMMGAYATGPFKATLAYEKHDTDTFSSVAAPAATNADERAWKLGLGYSDAGLTANFVYENINDGNTAAAGSNGHNAYYLSGKYAFGNDAVKLAYTRAGETDSSKAAAATNDKATQWAIGYDHSMSKNTTVYALYTKLNNNAGGTYALGAEASNAVSAAAPVGGTHGDPSAFSIGLKHAF